MTPRKHRIFPLFGGIRYSEVETYNYIGVRIEKQFTK